MSDQELDEEVFSVKSDLRRHGLRSKAIHRSMGLIREISFRQIGLRHHDVQIRGGLSMLRGELAEMDTGEGKTITAGLAAATAAMAGIPVHVITVNEYLAARDRETLSDIYDALGITHSVIEEEMKTPERQGVYESDIVYGSNSEFAFDYLRDQLAFGYLKSDLKRRLRRLAGDEALEKKLVLRGLYFAIVDEADSVLVDEARTPLIISRQTDPDDETAWAEVALGLAYDLVSGTHYKLFLDERRIELTEAGREYLSRKSTGLGEIWQSWIRREESLRQALSAIYLFHNGDHYLVNDGKVQIVDEYTGRLQPDRSWSDGLHQLVEFKEGVEVTGQNLSMARMTYQRLFRRYRMLAGMTGTAREIRGELWSVFGLNVNRIPPNKRSKLKFRRTKVYSRASDKWQHVVETVKTELASNRPVLIGARSVAVSQTVSAALEDAGVEHRVLNATNVSEEAEIVSQAGQPKCVTVATNMAGRGVDISLPPEVVEAGGLHVILTERHDSRRIDRQLAGRAGRRGEPGTVEIVLSLEDDLLKVVKAPIQKTLARLPLVSGERRIRLFDKAQKAAERAHAKARKNLVQQDKRMNSMLSFTGGLE